MRKAGVKDQVSPHGRLALGRVEPVRLAKHAVEAAAVARDGRVESPAGMTRSHVAASRDHNVTFNTILGASTARQSGQTHARRATPAMRRRRARICRGREHHRRSKGGVNGAAAADAKVHRQVLQLVAPNVK
eukprot:6196714-Pleurochrysis_carterae.AAC.1